AKNGTPFPKAPGDARIASMNPAMPAAAASSHPNEPRRRTTTTSASAAIAAGMADQTNTPIAASPTAGAFSGSSAPRPNGGASNNPSATASAARNGPTSV